MLRTGRNKILLADHTKVSSAGYFAYGSLSDYDLWITTRGIPAAILKRLRKMVKVLQVGT